MVYREIYLGTNTVTFYGDNDTDTGEYPVRGYVESWPRSHFYSPFYTLEDIFFFCFGTREILFNYPYKLFLIDNFYCNFIFYSWLITIFRQKLLTAMCIFIIDFIIRRCGVYRSNSKQLYKNAYKLRRLLWVKKK